jgi:uncharacterized protein
MNFNGTLILITGASRGIGAATAKALARKGARVLLLSRTKQALQMVADDIARRGGHANVYPVDLTVPEAIEQVCETIKNTAGIPDVIINNAGTGKWLFVEETENVDLVEMVTVPYLAAFNVTKAFLPEMLARKSGHIVNVTSAVAYKAIPGATAYTAACWAIRGFTEALRADLRGTGIGVTLFASGTVATPGFDHYPGVLERMPGVIRLVPVLTPDKAADAMIRGIEDHKREIVIPWTMRALLQVDRLLPRLTEWLINKTGWKHQ